MSAADLGVDKYRNMEGVIGTTFADTLNGSNANDVLVGNDGNDALAGFGGDDLYRFDATDGSNILSDTGGTADQITLTNAPGTVAFARQGDDLVLNLGSTAVTDQNHFVSGNGVEKLTFVLSSTVFGNFSLGNNTTYHLAQGLLGVTNERSIIVGGAGDDTITGGVNDTLHGGGANDILIGGAGNDTITDPGGVNSNNVMIGGTGDDTLISTGTAGTTSESNLYVFSTGDGNDSISDPAGVNDVIYMKLGTGTGAATLTTFRAYDDTAGAGGNLIIDYDGGQIKVLNHFAGASIDQIRFEGGSFAGYAFDPVNPYTVGSTGSGNAFITGTLLTANTVNGGAASDILFGGDQNDVLAGNANRDLLVGGSGADTFKYANVSDSGITVANADIVADFLGSLESGADKIDLSGIDTDTIAGGNQDFTWGGETNSVLAGQVTWFRDTANNRTIIQMDDADADLTIDMMIVLHGSTPCSSPTLLCEPQAPALSDEARPSAFLCP